jgi:uncharacterized protein (TIGR02145 family)
MNINDHIKTIKSMKTAKLFFSLLRRAILLPALALIFCANLHAQVLIGGTDRPKNGAILDLNSTAKGGLILSNITITDPEKIPYNSPNVFPGINASNSDVNLALRGAIVYNTGLDPALPAGIYVWNGYSWTQDGVCVPSIISSSPASIWVGTGKSVTLSVTSACPEHYQWYRSMDGTTDMSMGNAIPVGTDTASYTIPGFAQGLYYYFCKVSAASGEVISDIFTVHALASGRGTFTGKLCFDLAQGNDDLNGCGAISGREPTDFSNRNPQGGATAATAPYTGVQVYTFTPEAGKKVSHVRFEYVETTGLSVDHIVPESSAYATAEGIDYACRLTVYYREELNDELKGITRDDSRKLKLYVIYNPEETYSDPAKDVMIELSLSFQDCVCCGAYLDAAKTQWLNFMCHNLGADESYNPFKPSLYIRGAKYKWGVSTRALSQDQDQDPKLVITNWSTNPDYTIPPTGDDDWDMINANPCPSGWRIPTKDEWVAIAANNIRTSKNWQAGMWIGDALFLPVTGYRNSSGWLQDEANDGYYWSSSARSTTRYYYLYFETHYEGINGNLFGERNYGFSVRSVEE